MTDFNFYSETYCGSLIPADAWDAVCRDAEAQMNRYERIYHVSYPQTGSRNMAVCAMAEALYEFAQLQDADGVTLIPVSRVSLGFGSGGGTYGQTSERFGGGGGAGVKIDPVAFLVIKDGQTRMMPVAVPATATMDRVLEMAPQLIDRVEGFVNKKKEEKEFV